MCFSSKQRAFANGRLVVSTHRTFRNHFRNIAPLSPATNRKSILLWVTHVGDARPVSSPGRHFAWWSWLMGHMVSTGRCNCPYFKGFDGCVARALRCDLEWPGCSSDLASCDFLLWGYLISCVNTTTPQPMEDQKRHIQEETPKRSFNMLVQRVYRPRGASLTRYKSLNDVNHNFKCLAFV